MKHYQNITKCNIQITGAVSLHITTNEALWCYRDADHILQAGLWDMVVWYRPHFFSSMKMNDTTRPVDLKTEVQDS